MITDERLREMATHMEGFHPANTAYGVTAAEAQAMARELLSRRESDEWQPIETAPTDGSRVLAWCASWSNALTVQYYGYRWGAVEGKFPFNQPTHWRHLPQSPQGSTP